MKKLILSSSILVSTSILFTGCGTDNKFIGTFECEGLVPGMGLTYQINDNNKYKASSMGVDERGIWTNEDDNAIKITNKTNYKSIILEFKDDKYILGQIMNCKKVK